MNQIVALLTDPAFWSNVVLPLLLALVFMPNGIASRGLAALGGNLENFVLSRLPANQRTLVKTLAEEAVTYAWQAAEASWGNSDKKNAALQYLTGELDRLHIKYDAAQLGRVIDYVWSQVKGQVYSQGAQATAAKSAYAAVQAYPSAVLSTLGTATNDEKVERDEIGPVPAEFAGLQSVNLGPTTTTVQPAIVTLNTAPGVAGS